MTLASIFNPDSQVSIQGSCEGSQEQIHIHQFHSYL